MLERGMFMVAFDLTRSGRFQLGDLDQPSVKTSCIVNVATRHTAPLGANLTFHCIFMSSASLNVADDQLEIEYL